MTDFDRIIGSGPANATAAKVTSRAEHWEPATPLPPGMQHWKAPPPMKRFIVNPASPEHVDLTGKKFGRFTVVGFLDDDGGGKNRGCRWVCRCVCGDYEAKSTKAIRLLETMPDGRTSGFQCWYCTQWLVAQQRYKKHGSRPVSHFTKPQEKVVTKIPEDIIATRLAAVGTTPHARLAMMIVADLQKAGYRIVRDPAKIGALTKQQTAK